MNTDHYTPQHSRCARMRGTHTYARPLECRRRGLLVRRWLTWIRDWHRSWYERELARDRRLVEEEARRLGGVVVWRDARQLDDEGFPT